MSAIAAHLVDKGCIITGSDVKKGYETERLETLGAKIFYSHRAENVGEADAVIYNSAIKKDNPELLYAKNEKIPIYDRVEFLNEIARGFRLKIGVAGCHGKTTATAMFAHVLKRAGKKFLMHLGGRDNDLGNYFYSGNDIFLTEVCEFRRNIDRFNVDVASVLNVGFDHADCYKNVNDLKNTYFSFLDRAEKRVVNSDDKYLFGYKNGAIAYGLEKDDISAENISVKDGLPEFDVVLRGKKTHVKLNVYGLHNVNNALNAFALAEILGIGAKETAEGLSCFYGIKRRFEKVGYINGAEVICDYAHHPTEIAAAINTAESLGKNRIITVFQPHTYSRTKALMDDFIKVLGNVKNLIIYQTYAAREDFDESGSAERLFRNVKSAKAYRFSPDGLKKYLRKEVKNGDTVLVLGAGDVYDIVKDFSSSCR
ncbi:MAG: UDP-N-acetylmuramate--L-alanine ligase [Clostridia bacterium]|nr:UDP-N-acetylmuramate--L-alanine ligase [Clostridia bacterium]